jgi:lipid-binding SYLF domain-containing protein
LENGGKIVERDSCDDEKDAKNRKVSNSFLWICPACLPLGFIQPGRHGGGAMIIRQLISFPLI